MANITTAEKKRIITANCGGWQAASDQAIALKWSALTDETRKRYTEKAKVKKEDGSKPNPTTHS